MKANKALKRLAKVESLISDVTERYSAIAPEAAEALKEMKAAVARAHLLVSLEISAQTAARSPEEAPAGKPARKGVRRKTAIRVPAGNRAAKRLPKVTVDGPLGD